MLVSFLIYFLNLDEIYDKFTFNMISNHQLGESMNKTNRKTKISGAIHDLAVKELCSENNFSLDIFRALLTDNQFKLFNWSTLKSEVKSFVDEGLRESHADIIFSVQFKRTKRSARIIFLIEHKSYQAPKNKYKEQSTAVYQLFKYQTDIYRRQNSPVIPIILYHGKDKQWREPIKFHDALEGMTPTIRREFGKNVLNFECKLLNIHDLIKRRKASKLTSYPMWCILAMVWNLNISKVEKALGLVKKLPTKEGDKILNGMITYIQKADPSFTFEILKGAMERVLGEERGEKNMSLYELALKEEQEKGIEKGREDERRKNAKGMLELGADHEFVCKATGLSAEEVAKISEEIKSEKK